MNPKLPRPVQDALAREATAGDHPSADLLTAFVESTLSGNEKERVTDHLSRCSECREVVFLSGSLAQEDAAAQDGVASHAPATVTITNARQRWGWQPAMAAAVAVLLIVAAVILQQRWEQSRSERPIVAKVESKDAAVPTIEPQSTARVLPEKPRAAEPVLTQRPRSHELASQSRNLLTLPSAESSKADDAAPAPTQNRPAAKSTPPAAAADQIAASNRSASAGASAGESRDALAVTEPSHVVAGIVAGGQPAARKLASPAFALAAPRWQVTAEGHLEHFTQGKWTRVLADEPTEFRVVSIVRNDVWAGGSGGGLFHSTDGGKNWSRVVLPASPLSGIDAIVAIQFDDALHGTVLTASGARFSTRNGGLEWTKE